MFLYFVTVKSQRYVLKISSKSHICLTDINSYPLLKHISLGLVIQLKYAL